MANPISPGALLCPNCRSPYAPGATYCAVCGEPLNPALIGELRYLYDALLALDKRIATGEGRRTLTQLRDELRPQYLADQAAATAPGATPTPEKVIELRFLYRLILDLDARVSQGQGEKTVQEVRDEISTRYLAERRGPVANPAAAGQTGQAAPSSFTPYPYGPPPAPATVPLRPPAPPARAFSFGEFLADQAIAVMAYLGGFLMLVAALTFEIGAFAPEGLTNGVKLAVLIVIHLLFAALGFLFRRTERLRTVGGAYLFVFALMVPLVALAAYYFLLEGTISPTGMLTLSALYAALVYLFLAWRVKFVAYAYMGWVAFAIGMFFLPDWLDVPTDWSYSRLAIIALLMLLPTWGKGYAPLASIAQPGRLLGGITTAIAGAASLGLGLTSLVYSLSPSLQNSVPSTRILVNAGSLVLLALAWSATTRQLEPRQTAGVDLADAGVAAAIAYLAFSIGVASSLDRLSFAWLLNGVAIVEALGALALGRLQPARTGLRRGVYGVAQALATIAALAVVADPAPNWPLIIAVATALAITLLTAFRENAPWWLVVSGLYLFWLYAALLAAFVTPDIQGALASVLPELALPSSHYALLTLAVAIAGLALTWVVSLRKYAAPILLVAFFYGLITSLLVFLNGRVGDAIVRPSAVYQTVILALFTALALLAGHRIGAGRPASAGQRANTAAVANLFAAPFGLLLPIPALIHADSGVTASVMAVSVAIIALAIRRFLGRTWAITPYGIALWTTLLAIPQAGTSEADVGLYAQIGVSLPVALLLVIAALATVAALWENAPAAMIAPAAIAWLALFGRIDTIPALVVALAIFAVSAALYQFRGRGWDIPWLVAGALGSFGPLNQIRFADPGGPYWQVGALLVFAVAVYLLALQRRASAPYRATLEPLAAFYGVFAALAFPREDGYVPIVVYACVMGLLAAALRLRLSRSWALPLYGVAVFTSAISFAWLPGYDANLIAAIFLVYAAVSVAPVIAERNPVVGVVPALYASGAIIVQSDARLLLPIAVGLTLVGVAMSRWLGRAWAAPWYTAALIASVATAIRGASYPEFNYLALLALALVAYAVALVERSAWLTPLAALYGIWAIFVVPGPDQFLSTAAIAFGAILLGALFSLLARWSRLNAVFGEAQGIAGRLRWTAVWYAIAVIASLALPFRSGAYSDIFYIALFALAVEVYLVALLVERAPLLTAAAVLYGWWGALVLPDVNRLEVTVALACGVALLGGVVRLVAGRQWAISLYVLGALISLVSLTRIIPYDANIMEVVLLIYTAVAAVIALIERQPLAGIAPAIYASGVTLIQTDPHLLLPVAAGLGVAAMLLGRRFGIRWSLPWYIVTATASLATVIRGASEPDFEYLALIALTLLAYAIVAAEALPELLALPFALGAAALIVTETHFEFERWQIVLSLSALAYLYYAGQWLWRAIPWLATIPPRQYGDQPADIRAIGSGWHRGGGLVTAVLTALGAITLGGSFTPNEPLTLVAGGSVLAVAGLLALLAIQTNQRGLLYLAGLVATLAFSWGARWFDLENPQAYTLLPASYLLLVGALLPADKKLRGAVYWAAWASILGSFILLLPTFVQSFTDENDTLYLLILVAEAVVVVAVGLGTRARSLLLIGAGFIGVAAIRGAVIAVNNDVPIFVVFAALALLLIGGATWLSLAVRKRPETSAPTP
ncbi:MAG TPA: zinc ribbon domain-containing protein [Ktedonobacterales bacterium]|jgi:hypothetical protein